MRLWGVRDSKGAGREGERVSVVRDVAQEVGDYEPTPGASRTVCSRCGADVLAAVTEGGLRVLMEAAEILPRLPCPVCKPRGRNASPRQRDYSLSCWRCGDTGLVGEDLKGVLAVGVDEKGIARLFVLGRRREGVPPRQGSSPNPDGFRRLGESLHRAHMCKPA